MLENNAAMPFQSPADTAPTRRRSRTERARFDGRSKEARQIKALAAGYIARGAEPRAAQRCAELEIIASELRAKQLRGEPVDMAALLKAEGYAVRAVRALDLKPISKPMPTLRELLAQEPEQECT